MPTEPFDIPTSPTPAQLVALATAGTVRLPAPTPAYGTLRVHVALDDGGPLDGPHVVANSLLELVQQVSPLHKIIYYVCETYLRAVTLPDPHGPQTSPTEQARETISAAAFYDLISRDGVGRTNRREGDTSWSVFVTDTDIFLPENAPVLVRIEKSFGVTAAEAAAGSFTGPFGCCEAY